MSVERPQAEYQQVARIMRDRIRTGAYPAGSSLPVETQLAGELGVSRAVVNKALSLLRSEGLIKSQRGLGSTVNPIPVLRRNATARQRQETREASNARGAFDAEVRGLGLTPRSEVTVEETPAPPAVAEILGVEAGTVVLSRRRMMYANDIPVQIATSYLPLDIAKDTPLAERDTGQGGTYSRLAELGHAPARFSELTRLRAPEGGEAAQLGMNESQRVYEITRVARTDDGRAVEVTDSVLPAHQWEFYSEWDAG